MKTMKMNLVFALAAVLAVSPVMVASAADKKDDAAAAESAGPTPEQLKARKAKKPSYTKFAEAKTVAEKAGLPLIVALLPDGNPAVQFLKQKVINRKEFLKDFAARNCVLCFVKIKPDSKKPKQIETRGMKEPELKFLENFVVTENMKKRAEQQKQDEPKYTDLANYPAVICVDSLCQKELFRFAPYDKEGGFGVWLSQVVDNFRTAGIEPMISPLVNKIIDNPDDPKKWK